MTDRKKPSTGFWITVALVAVLVGYPLSIGPAIWITHRARNPVVTKCYLRFYSPIIWINKHGPEPVRGVINWYGNRFWTAPVAD